MSDPNYYREFAQYNGWANRRVAEMLQTLPDESLPRPLLLFSHLLRAEGVWLGRLRGTPDAAPPLWEADSLAVCRERMEANIAAFEAFISSLTSAELSTMVSYTNSQGTEYRTAVYHILSHVFNHATHHRGQIALLVREAGQVPNPLDLIVYLRSVG